MNRFLMLLIPLILPVAQLHAQENTSFTLRLNHIAIHVSDLKTSTSFYENVLLLKQIPEPFKDGLHTWFTLGPAGHVHLIQAPGANVKYNKTNHLCFSVSSIANFIANLEKHKVPYSNWAGEPSTITIRPDGVRQIYLQDPDGHWIEINDDQSVSEGGK